MTITIISMARTVDIPPSGMAITSITWWADACIIRFVAILDPSGDYRLESGR